MKRGPIVLQIVLAIFLSEAIIVAFRSRRVPSGIALYMKRIHAMPRANANSEDGIVPGLDDNVLNELWLDKYLSTAQPVDDIPTMVITEPGQKTLNTTMHETSQFFPSSEDNTAGVDQARVSSTNSAKGQERSLPLPLFNLENIGLTGGWKEKSGNYILVPPDGIRPMGVIHFIGGAFVGAAPHITYRYLLEALAKEGYVVVATPYRLDLDYLKICDGISAKFDAIGAELAGLYGPLPVVGLGHSLGALLQTLITALFPDTPRAVNILISFNNKHVKEAIPGFNEIIVPAAERVMGSDERSAKLRERLVSARRFLDNSLKSYSQSGFAPAFFAKDVLPFYEQSVEIFDQVPELLTSIAQGSREFQPSPLDTKESLRRMYRARRTLVLKFENDNIDESEDIAAVLREANTIMRMKRPMINMQVDFKQFSGSHVTPLTPNLLVDLSQISPLAAAAVPDALNPACSNKVLRDVMLTIDNVKDEILQFLDESIKQGAQTATVT